MWLTGGIYMVQERLVALPTIEIARSFGLTEAELMAQALRQFLLEKRREAMQERWELLSRYGVDSLAELGQQIAAGTVIEHPAWEDLIVVENLEASLEELDEHLRNL